MLRVLTYHRVDDPERQPFLDPGLISATPTLFAEQMAYLARRYEPVDLMQLLEARSGGTPLPRRAVLVSFDDGYRDFASIAWPILKRARVPVVLFVSTGYADHPERSYWWDRLYRAVTFTNRDAIEAPFAGRMPLRTARERRTCLGRLRTYVKELPAERSEPAVADLCERLGEEGAAPESVLGWGELRQLAADGVQLASHGEQHAILTRCTPDRVRSEVRNAQTTLEREIGQVPRAFAYPNGSHDAMVRDILREEGFDLAFTQRDGHNELSGLQLDPLQLCRTSISPRTSLPLFRLRLKTWFSHIDRWRHRVA
jgi:peptidoglycan/xylan/chitin deacetylase (PgdA/CDA1 family)